MRCSLFLLFVDMSPWAAVQQALFGQVHTSHQNTYHLSRLYKGGRRDGESEKKEDRFQYQPVIWLLRLDRIMPYRQTQKKKLPLMKYDMCANGAPPPIQQPIITFRNKYTKWLLKKKKRKTTAQIILHENGSDKLYDAPFKNFQIWLVLVVPFYMRHYHDLNLTMHSS